MTPHLLWSAAVAALGGFLFGFDTAVISGATDALRLRFLLDSNQLGFTVASALIGTIVGSIAAGPPCERYGRRPVLLILAVLYFLSAVGCGLAWDWWSLLLFRFIGGLAIGASSVVAPMYIAEISPAALRGRLVALSQFNVVAGILAAYFSNYIIAALVGGPETHAWRWMLGVAALPAVAVLRLPAADPREPALAGQAAPPRRGGRGAAARSATTTRHARARRSRESLHEETVSADEPFFQRKYLKPILLAIMVASFNQLAGINALIYYTADIFKMAGAERTSALLQSVIIGFTNLVFTMLAMTVIDRFGRRRLLLIGAVGLAVCLGLDGVGVPSWHRRHAGAGQPDRLHRLLRLLAGLGDLGLHQRDLPESRPRPRAGARQLHPLVLGGGGELDVPDHRRGLGRARRSRSSPR